MHTLKTFAALAILMPVIAFGQSATLQSQPVTTTGIEHEDIGITGSDSDGESSQGNMESNFKVEKGEKAMSPEYGVDGDPDVPIVTGHIPSEDKASPELMEPTNKGMKDGGAGTGKAGEEIGTEEYGKSTPDSFFDVFVDLHDDDTQAAVDAFLKIGDIKGESMNAEESGSRGESAAGEIKFGDGESGARPAANASEPKEIVVVGSKVRTELQKSNIEIRGWDPEKKEVTIKPADIKEGEDFLDFIGATVASDENIENVTFNFKKIKMGYDQPAKLFAIININMRVTTHIDEQGNVKVEFPWYRMFTKNNGAELSRNIEARVQEHNEISNVARQNGTDVEFLQDRAILFQAIVAIMKTMHDTAR